MPDGSERKKVMKPLRENKELALHLKTAELLIEGIKEAVNRNDGLWGTPEYSRESIKRRCVQARQELLRIYQEVNNE